MFKVTGKMSPEPRARLQDPLTAWGPGRAQTPRRSEANGAAFSPGCFRFSLKTTERQRGELNAQTMS